MKIKFVFFGTPQLSADILLRLKERGLVPSLVVTNPDRPQGRHMTPTPSPVKVWAAAHNVPFIQPETFDDFVKGQLSKVNSDVFIVVAYGAILPKSILDIPKHGALNVHYSLLPKYRGATPIESQILNDDRETGISIILLDEKMDHGPIVAQRSLQLTTSNFQLPWPAKASELHAAMNTLAGEMLAETIPLWVEGTIQPKEQDHSKATYTKKFTKADGEIDLNDDPYKNFLKIQAFEDSIGTFFFTSPPFQGGDGGGGENDTTTLPSAPLLRKGGDEKRIRVLVKSAECKDGKLRILRVVPEGRKEMRYGEFLRGVK